VWVGLFTMLLSGTAAFLECDLKKVVALSTLSHLGLIMLSLGLGERSLCFAHLNTHAAFKALLFIGVGTVIHSGYCGQEARSVTTLATSSPRLLGAMTVSMLSMCGFIFLSGWFTKEAILGAIVNSTSGLLLLFFFYLRLALTLAYSFRLFQIFFGIDSFSQSSSVSVSASRTCKAPVFILLIRSVLQGSWVWSGLLSWPSLSWVSDKVLVYFVLLSTVLLLLVQGQAKLQCPSPFIYLTLPTSFLGKTRLGAGILQCTESSAWHGAGLGVGWTLLVQAGVGLWRRSNALLFLFLVLLLA